MKGLKFLLWFLVVLCPLWGIAASQQPLPVDQVFQFSASVEDHHTLIAHWKIAPSYHLYKERFSYKLIAPRGAELGTISLPPGIPREDNILGKHEVYNGGVNVEIPIKHANGKLVTLKLCYQGCADNDFCYPPQTTEVTVDLNAAPGTVFTGTALDNIAAKSLSAQDKVTQLLTQGKMWLILLSFFGFGLLLAFTPCVLPMIPILSSIIVGQGSAISTKKAFLLSLVYVLAVSFTYAIAGVLVGYLGENLQTLFQAPWIILLFSLVFVALALSLFGLYEFQLSAGIQQKIQGLTQRQKGGSYVGVAVMGVLSALIVSPCVSAPLAGALVYIGTTGNALLGGFALFVLSLGMGAPLLVIGASSARLLPKAGPWTQTIKSLFGVLLLGMAIWMLERILPGFIVLLLWGILFLVSAVYLGTFNPSVKPGWGKLWKGLGMCLQVYGILLIIGAASGSSSPLQPLDKLQGTVGAGNQVSTSSKEIVPALVFKPIKTNDDLDRELALAHAAHKPVMLDFYADWCIACKDMEQNVFTNPQVKELLQSWVLLRADITANDKIDKALKERFDVIAPPTLLFFDWQTNEMDNARVVGEMNAKNFEKHLQTMVP